MATRIRLTRLGRRNRPYFRMVVADSRARRDGKFIELVGSYDPMKPKAERAEVNEDRILYWLDKGAQPSDTVRNILSDKGILLKDHLNNPAFTEAQKSEQMQKYELSRKARTKKEAPKKEAAAPVVEETPAAEAAPAVEEAPAVVEETPDTHTVETVESAAVAEEDVKEETAAADADTPAEEAAESAEKKESPAAE